MSTYLVALIVSDFKCIKTLARPVLSKNVEINVCARPNAVDQISYALNVSTKLIEFFEAYYNIEYPLPKSGKK
jgi:aminopeptidase N